LLESPFWGRLHEKCIGCSICTFLCPTCHCFDIVDEASGDKGQRVRNWDSCLSPLYSLETSGHNPRSTGRERTRQRIMHKLNYFPKLFGKLACVGCGRCVLYCPVDFDIRQTIKEIQDAKG
jgi:formate hydrogenlyase subunit 6/NADH:ubiquinone oxidoreductase subunit I